MMTAADHGTYAKHALKYFRKAVTMLAKGKGSEAEVEHFAEEFRRRVIVAAHAANQESK